MEQIMISLSAKKAKAKKGKGNKRSALLKLVMPYFGGDRGKQMEEAVDKGQPEKLRKLIQEVADQVAAKVGGIKANNDYKADYITQNLRIQTNVIEACHRYEVKKLVFLGSSCIYTKECPQPIKEEYLLTGPLEPTNDAYAIAKIAGIKMCQSYNQQYGCDFISVMPSNLYGPGDNFDLSTSHVFPRIDQKIS